MKKLFSLILSITLLLMCFGCGKLKPEGKIEPKEIKVENFNAINLKGKFRVFYVSSEQNFVAIETYPNLYKNLRVDVKGKELTIAEKREVGSVDFYNITIYSKFSPSVISISDSVELNLSSALRTDNLKMNLKNFGKFIGSVNTRRAEIVMNGRSSANFSGNTEDAYIKISDSAGIIAPYWSVGNLQIESTGSNYAEVNVRDSLKGHVAENAKFLYYNDPIRAFKIDKTAKVQNKKLQ